MFFTALVPLCKGSRLPRISSHLFGSPVQGELAAVRQTEGLVSYNYVIVTIHYNPFVSLTLNTFPYTGKAERRRIFAYHSLTQGRRRKVELFACTGKAEKEEKYAGAKLIK